MTPDQYRLILQQSDAKTRAAAEQAFQALLVRIRNGEKPQPAIAAVMRQFNTGVTSGLAEVFSALLSTSIGVAEMRDWPVGKVKLSDVLYTNAKAVSATTRNIIEQHMKGPQAARELAKALYEGYDFKTDPLDVAGKLETLPKYLKVEFNKALAAKLKTPALRAAYLQAIAEQEAGKGTEALQRVLKTAFYERNRYYANRIARTELHRAYTDRQSRELMGQARIQYVQIRLSSKHPKADVCDLHARLNAYGLGAGVYPKADAPKPPFHPHCFCVISPKIDLNPKLKPRFNPDAERAFMASLPFNEARQVAGSIDKRDRILAGKATVEEVYNEGKDELYKWRRVGDIVEKQNAPKSWRDAMNAPEWQAHLDGYKGGAGWLEEGGRIVLDEHGKFVERTKWLPINQWYADYVSANQSGRILPSKMDKVIAKAQAGGKLGKAEDRLLQWLYEYTNEQKELNKADASDIAMMTIANPQRHLDGMKKRFVEQVGDAGHEVLSELSKEFYTNNPGASISDHNLHLIKELAEFMED